MEVGVSGIDLIYPVLTEQNRCVRIMGDVTSQLRQLGENNLSDIGVPPPFNQQLQRGRSKERFHKRPGFGHFQRR